MKKTLLTPILLVFIIFSGNAQTTFGPKQTINANTGNDPYAIATGLIDGDAYADIITGTTLTNQLVWYKNNADGTFTAQTNIANSIDYVGFINLVDLNNDGFLDVLVTAYTSNSLTWYANDGAGNFGTEQLIGTLTGASGLATGDIDGDGTIDVVATSFEGDSVMWFANNGMGSFGSVNILDNTLTAPATVNLQDIDNDGDLDAVVPTALGSGNVDVIHIFRNDLIPGGTASFIKDATPVATGKNYFVNAIFKDVDGDNDYDVLATELNTSAGTGHLYWYENTGTGFTENEIATSVGNPSTVLFEDLDGDGLNDIVLSSGSPGSGNDIVWFKNNGGGLFGSEVVIDATQSNTYVMSIADFDNDTDLDIASLAYNQDDLNWFENQLIVLSTPSVSMRNLNIYPNPVNERLNFKGTFGVDLNVSVTDMVGKQVMASSISEGGTLDVSPLNAGLYILRIENSNTIYRFIKN